MPALKTATSYIRGFFGFSRAANAYPASKVDDQYPARPELSLDQKDMLGRMEHKQLLNSARHIYNAYPMVSGAINDIANHVIGNGWQPQFKGTDEQWGDKAESWLKEFYKVADVRGFPYSLRSDLYVGVISLLRDGEFFIYKTANAQGYPMIQFLESHRIGNRYNQASGKVVFGPYAGLTQRNGIAYNEFSRPVAYQFLGDKPEDDEWIPADRLQHIFDPKWFSQGRGISPLVYGLLDWLDVHGWRQNEKMAQMIISSIALIEANEEGAPKGLQARMAEAAAGVTGDTEGPTKPLIESFKQGMNRFIKINGSNIKALEAQRPSAQQADFEQRVLRGCFRALGWTYEQGLDSKGQGGANVRRDVAQNQKSVEHMQQVIEMPWIRIIVYALSAANALGALIDESGEPFELVGDYYKWRPQLPQKMTVDHGRDRRVDMEEIRSGARTMIQDIRDRGGDERDHLREQVKFYKMKREIADVEDIPREEWPEVFGTLLINPAAPRGDSSTNGDDPEEEEDEEPEEPTRNQPDEEEDNDED